MIATAARIKVPPHRSPGRMTYGFLEPLLPLDWPSCKCNLCRLRYLTGLLQSNSHVFDFRQTLDQFEAGSSAIVQCA